ncbi:MAG: tyrosine-type recombinase/integrase [Boseongicola sp. SB0665_bin_10]|nr:tyrosine-type recombinase/integrase [Boseongicola sp. SB0665_bin_10]
MLMTAYAAGLRVSEICHLQVADIDSGRMCLRVDQGTGNKDRYVLCRSGFSRSSATTGATSVPVPGCSPAGTATGRCRATERHSCTAAPSGRPGSQSPAASTPSQDSTQSGLSSATFSRPGKNWSERHALKGLGTEGNAPAHRAGLPLRIRLPVLRGLPRRPGPRSGMIARRLKPKR